MNRIRVFSSGFLFVFAIYCLLKDPDLPFDLTSWVYLLTTIYFTNFPIKDMTAAFHTTLYNGRQFSKQYFPNNQLD